MIEKEIKMAQEEFERNQEMWKLRHVYGWTNTAIGDKYKVSRERVRQIIGNTGRFFRREWTEKLRESGRINTNNLHFTEVKTLPGVTQVWKETWSDERYEAKSGLLKMNQEFEDLTLQILMENGIGGKIMPSRHPYGILTDGGIRVDVRVTNTDVSKFDTQNCVYPTYQVPELYSGKHCDFFFIFVPEGIGYTYFVIPAWEFRRYPKGSRIRIPWPKMGKKPSKWHEYHKRVDLVKTLEFDESLV